VNLDRPRTRRHRYLWPLIVTVVVIAALGLARINDEAAAAVEYLDGIRLSAKSLSGAASSFASLGAEIGATDRARFQTVIDKVTADLETAAGAVAEPPGAGSLVGVASLYRLTLSTWKSGVATFAEGMFASADEGGAGSDRIYAGLEQVAAGDSLYQGVLAELARDDVPDPIGDLPELRFLDPSLPAGTLARLFAMAAASPNSPLRLRADLAVGQVNSVPDWVADPDGNLVVAATESLTIEVVVVNHGNAGAPAQVVNLEVLSPEGSELRQENLSALSAGSQTTVRFPDLPVRPGNTYQLSVALQLTVPDADPTNNSITLGFNVNEAAS
jgi:hypothetical protein